MTIYKGSQKEGKIYKGGIKISKIYKGSQLVYQSGPQIQLYGYTNSDSKPEGAGMIGGMSTAFPYYYATSLNVYPKTIKSMNGSLGTSGSTITYLHKTSDYTATYNRQVTINGIKLYFYLASQTFYFGIWVMEGSIVGSTILPCDACNTRNLGFPNSCDSNSMTHYVISGSATHNRNASLDKIWTLNGLI